MSESHSATTITLEVLHKLFECSHSYKSLDMEID